MCALLYEVQTALQRSQVQIVNISNCILDTGHTRNVFFPFDTIKDTAIEVAVEMVKELEISHLEPLEIAAMIDHEVSALVPTWRDRGTCQHQRQHSFNYEEYEDINNHHPFFLSSNPSSPPGSRPMSGSSYKTHLLQNGLKVLLFYIYIYMYI